MYQYYTIKHSLQGKVSLPYYVWSSNSRLGLAERLQKKETKIGEIILLLLSYCTVSYTQNRQIVDSEIALTPPV